MRTSTLVEQNSGTQFSYGALVEKNSGTQFSASINIVQKSVSVLRTIILAMILISTMGKWV